MCVRKMIDRKLGLILMLLSFFIIIGSVSASENTANNATAVGDNAAVVSCVDHNIVFENSTDVQATNQDVVGNNTDVQGDNCNLASDHEDNAGGVETTHNIASSDDFVWALNHGGDYNLTQDFSIGNIGKTNSGNLHINGNGHTICGADDEYSLITLGGIKICFENCVFDNVCIDTHAELAVTDSTFQNIYAEDDRASIICAANREVSAFNCRVVNCNMQDVIGELVDDCA